jgi:hypothetical protein
MGARGALLNEVARPMKRARALIKKRATPREDRAGGLSIVNLQKRMQDAGFLKFTRFCTPHCLHRLA